MTPAQTHAIAPPPSLSEVSSPDNSEQPRGKRARTGRNNRAEHLDSQASLQPATESAASSGEAQEGTEAETLASSLAVGDAIVGEDGATGKITAIQGQTLTIQWDNNESFDHTIDELIEYGFHHKISDSSKPARGRKSTSQSRSTSRRNPSTSQARPTQPRGTAPTSEQTPQGSSECPNSAPVEPAADSVQQPEVSPELRVGDRVRIIKAPRNVGKLATVTEDDPNACYGRDLLILPDGDSMVMSILASGVELVERPEAIAELVETEQPKEAQPAPTHEIEEQAIATPPPVELKIGDRVQLQEFCFGESRLATGEIKERPSSCGTSSYLCAELEVKLPPIEEVDEQYHAVYPADGIHTSTVVVNKWFLKNCTVVEDAIAEEETTQEVDSANTHELEGETAGATPDALDTLIDDLKSELEPAIASTPAVVMMSDTEARACVDSIKGHLENARKLLLDLYEREGWKALGYNSWRECAGAEFGESKSQLYRELEAAKIERNISPIGEIGQIKESHLRPLAKLEPEQQREVWQEAVTTAPKGKVTAAHVQAVVEKRQPEEEIPSLEELFKLYGQIAERVEHRPTHKYRNQFAVERTAYPAFSLYPLGRREAWQAWQRKYRKFLELYPLPVEKQMLHPGYPLSEPKPVVEAFPVQQSCKTCEHRHLIGDGSEFTCGTKGEKWTCAVTRDWAEENSGCDKFKPFSHQSVTVQPPANDKAEEAEAIALSETPEQRIPIYAFDLSLSQYNKLAAHAKTAGISMVGYIQKMVEELPEA